MDSRHSARRRRTRSALTSGKGGAAATVVDLGRRFDAFRKHNRRHAPIPAELRAAVARALSQGAEPVELRRACRLSGTQLERWSAEVANVGSGSAAEPDAARVFSVVEDSPDSGARATAAVGSEPLELRVGPWSVSIRLAQC